MSSETLMLFCTLLCVFNSKAHQLYICQLHQLILTKAVHGITCSVTKVSLFSSLSPCSSLILGFWNMARVKSWISEWKGLIRKNDFLSSLSGNVKFLPHMCKYNLTLVPTGSSERLIIFYTLQYGNNVSLSWNDPFTLDF